MIIAFVAGSHLLLAQLYGIGSRANAVGYAATCFADEWAIFNNPAGAFSGDRPRMSTTYDAFPAMRTLDRFAAAFSLPLNKFGFNAGFYRMGDALYSENIIAFAAASKLGIAALGVSVKYHQYAAEGFGSRGVPLIGFGGIADLAPWLKVGAYITQINQPEIAKGEKIQTSLAFGMCFRVSESVDVLTEITKEISEAPLLKAGLEYRMKKFVARTGFHPTPAAGFLGFGFHPNRLSFDYAFSYMPAIGNRHQAMLSYAFRKKS